MTHPNRDSLPFKILCRCNVTHDRLTVSWHGNTVVPATIIDEMNDYWRREIEATARRDYIFNGDLCRLLDWQATHDQLTLELGYTNYKQLLFSNHLHESAGEIDEMKFCARALGISAILVTADSQFVLMRRSKEVGEGAGLLDLLGGHVEPVCHLARGVPDPFLAMYDELQEEIDLRPDKMTCIGLVETRVSRKPELVFSCHTNSDFRSLLATARDHGCPEVAELMALDDDMDTIRSFVLMQPSGFSPSAAGCIWLYLQSLEDGNGLD